MNILYVNANPRNKLSDAAGYATHMAKTIKGFEAAGHRVVKLLAGETRQADEVKRKYRQMSAFLPRGASKTIRDVYEVLHDYKLTRMWQRLAAHERVDFVYERMNSLHVCGLRLSRHLKVPLVLEINDPLRETVTVDFSRLMKRYAIHLEDRLVQKSELIVVGSQALKRSYVRRGCPEDKLLVLYPTADMNLFRPGPSPVHDETRRRYGLHGKTVVGFVAGDISASWRRTDMLIDALPVILKKHLDLRVLIVGDGDLKQLSHRLGADVMNSVAITGKVPYSEVYRYINAMDICVIPNATWYGSPTKLFEYGAMMRPVVAPSLPPIQEVVEHGVSGLLFQPCEQEDMIRQILLLLENPMRREQLGQNLHDRISSLCTWETNTEAVIRAVSRCRDERLANHNQQVPSKSRARC